MSLEEDVELDDEDLDDEDAPTGVLSFDELPDQVAELKKLVSNTENQIKGLVATLEESRAKKSRWAKENARRRHDYVPFLLCALKHMAKKGALVAAFDEAKAKTTSAENNSAEKAA